MSPGRPKKRPEDRRTIRKGVAFSQAEYDRVCLVALRLRMDVNEFIRLMVLPQASVGVEEVTTNDPRAGARPALISVAS